MSIQCSRLRITFPVPDSMSCIISTEIRASVDPLSRRFVNTERGDSSRNCALCRGRGRGFGLLIFVGFHCLQLRR